VIFLPEVFHWAIRVDFVDHLLSAVKYWIVPFLIFGIILLFIWWLGNFKTLNLNGSQRSANAKKSLCFQGALMVDCIIGVFVAIILLFTKDYLSQKVVLSWWSFFMVASTLGYFYFRGKNLIGHSCFRWLVHLLQWIGIVAVGAACIQEFMGGGSWGDGAGVHGEMGRFRFRLFAGISSELFAHSFSLLVALFLLLSGVFLERFAGHLLNYGNNDEVARWDHFAVVCSIIFSMFFICLGLCSMAFNQIMIGFCVIIIGYFLIGGAIQFVFKVPETPYYGLQTKTNRQVVLSRCFLLFESDKTSILVNKYAILIGTFVLGAAPILLSINQFRSQPPDFPSFASKYSLDVGFADSADGQSDPVVKKPASPGRLFGGLNPATWIGNSLKPLSSNLVVSVEATPDFKSEEHPLQALNDIEEAFSGKRLLPVRLRNSFLGSAFLLFGLLIAYALKPGGSVELGGLDIEPIILGIVHALSCSGFLLIISVNVNIFLDVVRA